MRFFPVPNIYSIFIYSICWAQLFAQHSPRPAWWHNVGCTRPDRCTPWDHITALIAWWAHPRNPGPYHRLDPAHSAFNPNRRRHLLEPQHQIYWPSPSFPITAWCPDRVVVYVAPQTGVAEPHRILLLPPLCRLLLWRQHQTSPLLARGAKLRSDPSSPATRCLRRAEDWHLRHLCADVAGEPRPAWQVCNRRRV
jgi:hypothetical protein